METKKNAAYWPKLGPKGTLNPDHTFKLTNVPSVLPGITSRNNSSCFALRCDCEDGFMCHAIGVMLRAGNTDSYYWRSAIIKELKKSLNVYFVMQVFQLAFHPVLILNHKVEAWDDTGQTDMLILNMGDPYPDLLVPESTASLSQAYRTLNTFDGFDLEPYQNAMQAFSRGGALTICSNHNFGSNERLNGWLNGWPNPGNDNQSAIKELANLFTLAHYNLCYICYRNQAALFSMVEI